MSDPASKQALEDEELQSDQELGSIHTSLKRLPVWYQLSAMLLSAILPFFLNDFVVLSWASTQLHFDFGTSMLWTTTNGSTAYYDMVNKMSIRERLGFAGYALALVGVVFTLRSITKLGQVTTALGDSGSGEGHVSLFPRWPRVAQAILVCSMLEMLFLLNHVISDAIESPEFHMLSNPSAKNTSEAVFVKNDAANVVTFDNSPLAFLDPISSVIVGGHNGTDTHQHNAHFVVQVDILIRFLSWWLRNVGFPSGLALLYRLARDWKMRRVHAFRWVAVNVATARMICYIVSYYMELDGTSNGSLVGVRLSTSHSLVPAWEDMTLSQWSFGASFCLLAGALNYCYGPTNRCTDVVYHSSIRQFVSSSIAMILRAAVISLMCGLLVITVAVGVHIIELFLLWLVSFCALIWAPTMVDCCSVELMLSFAVMFVFVNEHVPLNGQFYTGIAPVTATVLGFLFQLSLSMAYNLVCFVVGSRTVTILSMITVPLTCVVMYGYVVGSSALTLWQQLGSCLALLKNEAWQMIFAVSAIAFISLCAIVNSKICARGLVACGQKSRKLSIPILHTVVVVKKLVYLMVLAFDIAVSLGSSMAATYVLSHSSARALPVEVSRIVACVVGVALFGTLSDLVWVQYRFTLRCVGMIDPPEKEMVALSGSMDESTTDN